jgi:hypothetical protein
MALEGRRQPARRGVQRAAVGQFHALESRPAAV